MLIARGRERYQALQHTMVGQQLSTLPIAPPNISARNARRLKLAPEYSQQGCIPIYCVMSPYSKLLVKDSWLVT